MGVDIRYNSPIDSMKALLAEGFDAVFVGSGAPRGKELDLPGRHDTDRIHIGIDWLESVAFGHTDSIGEKVLIIGVGNTAMDCCRSIAAPGRQRDQGDGAASARLLQGLVRGNWRMPKKKASRSSSIMRRSASSSKTESSSAWSSSAWNGTPRRRTRKRSTRCSFRPTT